MKLDAAIDTIAGDHSCRSGMSFHLASPLSSRSLPTLLEKIGPHKRCSSEIRDTEFLSLCLKDGGCCEDILSERGPSAASGAVPPTDRRQGIFPLPNDGGPSAPAALHSPWRADSNASVPVKKLFSRRSLISGRK